MKGVSRVAARAARRRGSVRRVLSGGRVAVAVLLALVTIAALAPLIAPGDPLDIVARPLLAPFADPRFALGTDQLGRDVLAALVHGARVSLVVGTVAALATLGVGVVVGTVAGFLGGIVDDALMRVTEAVQTVPTFLLALALVSVLGASAGNVVLAIGLSSWPPAARLVRAEVLRVKTHAYVDAARLIGRRTLAIAFVEILPGALQPLVALVGITVGEAILVESALAFLGLGDPNLVSWGAMIANGRALIRTTPTLVVVPGIAIALTVLAVSVAGDALAARAGLGARR